MTTITFETGYGEMEAARIVSTRVRPCQVSGEGWDFHPGWKIVAQLGNPETGATRSYPSGHVLASGLIRVKPEAIPVWPGIRMVLDRERTMADLVAACERFGIEVPTDIWFTWPRFTD